MHNQTKKLLVLFSFAVSLFFLMQTGCGLKEKSLSQDQRMEWWREARFGMFIHWGLYAVPAGEWQGETGHAEWIRTTAQIPLDTYDEFRQEFNPVKFDARKWVSMAKDAGMNYIVITSKHHDGFCLFDSDQTDFDIMSTPFKRDIMAELAEACREQGMKICWYYSIMDWHHPDYLPRRGWETKRSAEGADFDEYVAYMKRQLKELITRYGDIGVLWFDGEWETTWNREYGFDLYTYVRSLQPDIIINNRVGAGRSGMQGLNKEGEFAGDFGTPEQQIPATGLPGEDWETCMTMNGHWGWNKHDHNWKSSADLIRKLADIASKGGNFLLNVGPKADGTFPEESRERLRDIGEWMDVNGESIYGTEAGPFADVYWGRCTQKSMDGKTRLYLHVFEWPENRRLRIPGIYNSPSKAFMLADETEKQLDAVRDQDAIVISLPGSAPDTVNSVVVLDIEGRPDVSIPPEICAEHDLFIDSISVELKSSRENVTVRYTTDGTEPDADSPKAAGPLVLKETAAVSARCFRGGSPVSGTAVRAFTRVRPKKAESPGREEAGIRYAYYEGDWDTLPDFASLEPVERGTLGKIRFSPRNREEYFGFVYTGYVNIPETGVYTFYTDSDDGSALYIGNDLVVDNNGLHGLQEQAGVIALDKGYHSIRIEYFEKTGGDELHVLYKAPGREKEELPAGMLFMKQGGQ